MTKSTAATKAIRVMPESRPGVTIYKTHTCSACQRKIYEICEDVYTDGTLFFHALCKLQLEAKQKEKVNDE